MANDNQTALMQSIQRKKDRVKELEKRYDALTITKKHDHHGFELTDMISFLDDEITEDEKLLEVDGNQIQDAFIDGWQKYDPELPFSTEAKNYYKDKYGTDGK